MVIIRKFICIFFVLFFIYPTQAEAGAEKLLAGAREEASRAPFYTSGYYRGGYPPETVGVCTDVIWRAFRVAGLEIKELIDSDIKANPSAYPCVAGRPDRNIDFRRVPNQSVFFRRHAEVLSTAFKPGDAQLMSQWQAGDIVVFKNPDHIAIVSDKKNRKGVPLLLHNEGPWASEGDDFEKWAKRGIVAHYRWKF